MMVEVKIQEATIENLKDIQKLNLELFEKEYKEFDDTLNCKWTFSKKGEKYFKRMITSKNCCAFIALDNKRVVGYLVGELGDVESYRNISQIAVLENMFILENYRNLGVGTKLYQAFINWCKSKSINRGKVVVSAKNFNGINFYKKNGFFDYNVTLEAEL